MVNVVHQIYSDPKACLGLDDSAKMLALTIDPFLIKDMDNPSDAVCKHAIAQGSGHVLQYIKAPSFAVRMAALKETPTAIKYIQHPSTDEQNCAINANIDNIHLIKEPSSKTVETVLRKRPSLAQYIKNIPDEVLKTIVKKDASIVAYTTIPDHIRADIIRANPMTLRYITDTSEAEEEMAVEINPACIQFINEPNEITQIKAIKKSPQMIQHVNNPTDAVLKAVLIREPKSIKYIADPTEEYCILAVSTSASVLCLIKNPTEKVIDEALKRSSAATLLQHTPTATEDQKRRLYNANNLSAGFTPNLPADIQMDYVKKNGVYSFHVFKGHIHDEVYLNILKTSASAVLEYTQRESIVTAAIKHAPTTIKHVLWPTLEQQKIAVEKNPDYIIYITTPHPDIVDLVYDKVTKPAAISRCRANTTSNTVKMYYTMKFGKKNRR